MLLTLNLALANPVSASSNNVLLRANISSTGSQSNNPSQLSSISDDGEIVGFQSSASNLVPDDTNGQGDAFVRNLRTGITKRVSTNSSGQQMTGYIGVGSAVILSGDGNFAAFTSGAAYLNSDTNNSEDVYIKDLTSNAIEIVSISNNNSTANSFSNIISVSSSGRFIVFTSNASNLVSDDTNATSDVFIRDRELAITERISVDSNGVERSGGDSGLVEGPPRRRVTDDGRFVIFNSYSNNPGTHRAAYLRDRQANTTELVSLNSQGQPNINEADAHEITNDGQIITFTSTDPYLVPNLTPTGIVRTFIRDRANNTTSLIQNGNNNGGSPTMTADGNTIYYESERIVSMGILEKYDRQSNAYSTINFPTIDFSPPTGHNTPGPFATNINSTGSYITFTSFANNYVSNDTNNETDVFIYGVVPPPPPSNLSVLPGNPQQLTLAWTAAVDGGSPITGYKIYRGTTTTNMLQVGSVSGGVTSFTDTVGSSPSYYYSVSAVNNSGEGIQSAILQAINPWFLIP